MDKIKVIEFIQSVGDGGAETLVKDYAQLLDREEFDVTVVVMHGVENSANLQRLKAHNIQIIELSSEDDFLKRVWRRVFWKKEAPAVQSEDVQAKPVLPGETYEEETLLRRCRNRVRNLFFGIKFLKVLRQTGATVVHAHLDMLSCLRAVSWGLKGVRLFHTCHALPNLIYAGEEGVAANYLIRHNRLQLIALHADVAAEIDTMFPDQKTQIIRNGVNMTVFQNPGVTKQEKRAELSIPEDAFVLGHVGRFTPEKNHPFLVEVFRETVKKCPNAYLLMIGAADNSHIRQKLAEYGLDGKYQILSGRKDINELLAAMDVFVFPSIFEGFPVSLIEAQAAGLRCIVSDQCPGEVVRTEICIPMPLKAPESWAEAVLDPDRKRDSSEDLNKYDMNREIRRLEKLYLARFD